MMLSAAESSLLATIPGISSWPGGVVPYVMPPRFPAALISPSLLAAEHASRQRILSALAHYHQHTAIRFVPRSSRGQPNYVAFEWSPSECSSFVGAQGGRQVVKLVMMGAHQLLSNDPKGMNVQNVAAGCSVGDTIHELGHVIGFSHQQTRMDRDQYIEQVSANLKSEFNSLAAGYAADTRVNDVGRYDYGSIMHYEPAGSAARVPNCLSVECAVLLTKSTPYLEWKQRSNYGHDTIIGQKDGLSHGDIHKIQMLYGRPKYLQR